MREYYLQGGFDMSEYGKNGLDQSGFHYDDCAGGPCDCDEKRYGHRSSGGPSIFEVVLIMAGGLILEAVIATALKIDVEDMSAFVLLIFWLVCELVVGWILQLIKSMR